MKRIVWRNKSNDQLCATIPKGFGIDSGDVVEIEKKRIKKIVYAIVVGDLFHYGHLQSLEKSRSFGDYLICGVLTSKGLEDYRKKSVANYDERKAVISNLRCVDRVMPQNSLDPTENLKKIYQEFPNSQIILVHGDNWEKIPGEDFVKSINGELIKTPYYERLSDFNILKNIFENYKNQFEKLNEFESFFSEEKNKNNVVSTKAKTLDSLRQILTKSKIERPIIFTVEEWNKDKESVLRKVQQAFKNDKLVVRSSAIGEDSFTESMAGKFESILNVNASEREEVSHSIQKVIDSYKKNGEVKNNDQVLIQRHVENISMSGVIFTRESNQGSPYYVINYDDATGSTDSVTKGVEHKTVKISYFYNKGAHLQKWESLLDAVFELEKVLPEFPLDIEFGVTNTNEIIFFQVRPLTTKIVNEHKKQDYLVKKNLNLVKENYSLSGDYGHKIFSDMSFWNPAEIIGESPNNLDYSLYDYLIMSGAWQTSLIENGYTKTSKDLMVRFGNKPYINVISSFNFLTPFEISKLLRNKLLHFYEMKLKKNPEIHDKIEFYLVYNYHMLNFDEKVEELREFGFNENEIFELKEALLSITNNIIKDHLIFLDDAKKDIDLLGRKREEILSSNKSLEIKFKLLLDNCRDLGIFHFSRIARFAFIAKSFLEEMVDSDFISREGYEILLSSINSPVLDFRKDFNLVINEKLDKASFMKKYGHLRPGTYDITSSRYDSFGDSFFNTQTKINFSEEQDFEFENKDKINDRLINEGFDFDCDHLLSFIKNSIKQREYIKFEFTKNLSEALEVLSEAGKSFGLSRNDLSKFSLDDVFALIKLENPESVKSKINALIKERTQIYNLNKKILLPSIIFSADDFDVVNSIKARPNFITQKEVSGEVVFLEKNASSDKLNLDDKLVFIENADPGFDWIFTKNILGLVTNYGGVASHMAIRCEELGIPAAIGCGETLFNKFKAVKKINLNCKNGKVEAF